MNSPFVWESEFPCSVEELFAWHERPGAFERLNPPWRPVQVLESTEGLRDGGRIRFTLPAGPFNVSWLLEHRDYIAGAQFGDEQIKGPFRSWKHLHLFSAVSNETARLKDEIKFEVPPLLAPTRGMAIAELMRLFKFRHALTRMDLIFHAKWNRQPRQTVIVSGASGLVGRALCAFLTTAGHSVIRLVRRPARANDERFWSPDSGALDPAIVDGADVVVHLGGENIAGGLWTEGKKKRLYDSRISSTTLLANTIKNLSRPPHTFISASAIGFYGNTGESSVDEQAPKGSGFLAELCHSWEESAKAAATGRTRVVNLRIGVLLNARGGVLGKLLPLFKFALGGKTGNGAQFVSWISLQDLLGSIEECIFNTSLEGAVNGCSPNPCTNSELANALGRILHRPALLPAPASVLRGVLGEMAEEVLLMSTRALPNKLLTAGFTFQLPSLEDALRFECGRLN